MKEKNILYIYLIVLILLSIQALATPFSPQTQKEIDLVVGEQKTLKVKSSVRVDLSSPQNLILKRNKSNILLIGKKPGQAFLKITSQPQIKVVIFPSKLEPAKHYLEGVLEGSPPYLFFHDTTENSCQGNSRIFE